MMMVGCSSRIRIEVGFMDGEPNFAMEPDSQKLEFERIDGEFEAAMVFAAASEYHSQQGNAVLANACLTDAADGYEKVQSAVLAANLSGAQLQELTGKLMRLKDLLDRLGLPRQHEAA